MTTINTHRREQSASDEQQQSRATGNAPTHAAYHVRDIRSGKGFWTRIGSAWAHADGCGYTVQLDSVPVDGRLSLRVISEKQD